MIAPVSAHEVVSPRTLAEALAFLREHAGEGWRALAGGTDLLVVLNAGREPASRWLDLSRLRDELGRIEHEDGWLSVGGLVTMTRLRSSGLARAVCPMIGEAAATIGGVQIQNRATVAGNVVNASPAGDTLPVWLALDAEAELASAAGRRRVPYRDFHTGYRTTALAEGELLTAIRVPPPPPGRRFHFRKIGTRAAQAISKVVLAAAWSLDAHGAYRDVRLAFGSMAEVPKRARGAEQAAEGHRVSAETGLAAAARLPEDLTPIDDVRSTAAYRMTVARNLVRELLAGRLACGER